MKAIASGDEGLIGILLGTCCCWAMNETRVRVDIWELIYLKQSLHMAVVRPEH